MSTMYHASYIGPLVQLYGRCALVRPVLPYPKVQALFDLPTAHPRTCERMDQMWHGFEIADFQPLKPIPDVPAFPAGPTA